MKTPELIIAWMALFAAVVFILIIAITAGLIVWDSYQTSKRLKRLERERRWR